VGTKQLKKAIVVPTNLTKNELLDPQQKQLMWTGKFKNAQICGYNNSKIRVICGYKNPNFHIKMARWPLSAHFLPTFGRLFCRLEPLKFQRL
jgi:hypothetical protein